MPTYRVKMPKAELPKDAILVSLVPDAPAQESQPVALFFKKKRDVDLANAAGLAKRFIDETYNPGTATWTAIELDV